MQYAKLRRWYEQSSANQSLHLNQESRHHDNGSRHHVELQRVEFLRRGSDFTISRNIWVDFDLFSRFSGNSDGSGGLGGVF